MHQLKKISLYRFLLIVVLESASSNFILPVTPTIIKNLNLPDSLFGLSYAGMSLSCFLFAPFWGKISNKIGRVNVYATGCIGYALAQVMFCFSTTYALIMAARIISGVFIGAINVIHLAYLIDISSKDDVGKNVITMSTLVSVSCTFGYLVGGVMGDCSIFWTFMFQILILAGCGAALFVFVKDAYDYKCNENGITFKDINPFSSMLDCRKIMNRTVVIWMSVFFLLWISNTACDQCFNFYLKDQFNFPPSYNGYLKALMGVITLLVNFTLCRMIVRKNNIRRSFGVNLLLCAAPIIIMLFSKNIIVFLVAYIVYFAFNAINTTLQQSVVSNMENQKSSAQVVAFYNSVQSLGSVIGAAAAGLIYGISSTSSFVFGCVLIIAAVFMMGVDAAVKRKPSNSL